MSLIHWPKSYKFPIRICCQIENTFVFKLSLGLNSLQWLALVERIIPITFDHIANVLMTENVFK